MNIALITNALTIVFCIAVLVQSVRMMRSLRTVKDGALTQVVEALDKSTGQARAVLSELKVILATDCAANARLVDQARALRDELSDMIGIADASAERIVSAVGLANAVRGGHDHGGEDLIVDEAMVDAEAAAEKIVGRIAEQQAAPKPARGRKPRAAAKPAAAKAEKVEKTEKVEKAEKTTRKPVEKAGEKSGEKPVDKAGEKTAGKPADAAGTAGANEVTA